MNIFFDKLKSHYKSGNAVNRLKFYNSAQKLLYYVLEKLGLLNTHYIVLAGNPAITRKSYEEDEVYAFFLGLKFT